MALKDRKPGDGGQLQRVADFNKIDEDRIAATRQKNIEILGDLMTVIPQLNPLNRMMLTDSNGQHKDRKNDNRFRRLSKNAKPIKTIDETNEEQDFRDLY